MCVFFSLNDTWVTLEEVLVDGDLLCGIIGLGGEVAMVIKERLMLGIEFEALILEVVPFLEDRLKLECERVIDELVLDGGLELLEQLDQLIDLDLVALHELLLVPQHRPLEALVHALSRLLDVQQQSLYQTLRLLHGIERNLHVLL
jgi:hypothetical protein